MGRSRKVASSIAQAFRVVERIFGQSTKAKGRGYCRRAAQIHFFCTSYMTPSVPQIPWAPHSEFSLLPAVVASTVKLGDVVSEGRSPSSDKNVTCEIVASSVRGMGGGVRRQLTGGRRSVFFSRGCEETSGSPMRCVDHGRDYRYLYSVSRCP